MEPQRTSLICLGTHWYKVCSETQALDANNNCPVAFTLCQRILCIFRSSLPLRPFFIIILDFLPDYLLFLPGDELDG